MKNLFRLPVLLILSGIFVGWVMSFNDRTPPMPTPGTVGQPQVVSIVLDASLTQYEDRWKAEVGRRLSNAVIVMVHGEDYGGHWFASAPWGPMDQIDVVDVAHKQYPDRTVVLISCNPGHYHLGVKGVYYAMSNVWLVPDRAVTVDDIHEGHRLTVNDIKTTGINLDPLIPTTEPTTRPTTQPFWWLPFDFPSINFPKRDPLTRWKDDPDVVGNVFEFVVEK